MEIITNHYKIIILSLAALNLVWAAVFFIMSGVLTSANNVLKRSISLEKIEKALDKSIDIDAGVMKMRKAIGALCLFVAAALIFIYLKP